MDAELAKQARALLFAERNGMLSTISVRRPGYPYGSITPYAVSRQGTPIILISTLAAHTHNLAANPRACLLVGESGAASTPQAGGRVSLMGRFARVPEADENDARARYLARVPEAKGYFGTHDFQLWEMAVDELRIIAGFGKMAWLDGSAVARDPATDLLAEHATGAATHMNNDHAEALRKLCLDRGCDPAGARMVGLDVLGIDLETEQDRLRFDFPHELASVDEVRTAIIRLVRGA